MNTLKNIRFALALVPFFAIAGTTACAPADTSSDVDQVSNESSTRAHFDLWEDGGLYYFQMVAGNGEAVLDSQAYTNRTGALNGILSVLDNGTNPDRYAVTSREGQAYVALIAANGEVIALTEGYASISNANRAVDSAVAALANYVPAWEVATGERFQIFMGSDRQFYFRVAAGNGEILLRSEGYESKAAALNGAYAVKDYGMKVESIALNPASNGGFYLNVMAPNNEIVATSEVYATRAGAERARTSLAALLPTIDLI